MTKPNYLMWALRFGELSCRLALFSLILNHRCWRLWCSSVMWGYHRTSAWLTSSMNIHTVLAHLQCDKTCFGETNFWRNSKPLTVVDLKSHSAFQFDRSGEVITKVCPASSHLTAAASSAACRLLSERINASCESWKSRIGESEITSAVAQSWGKKIGMWPSDSVTHRMWSVIGCCLRPLAKTWTTGCGWVYFSVDAKMSCSRMDYNQPRPGLWSTWAVEQQAVGSGGFHLFISTEYIQTAHKQHALR